MYNYIYIILHNIHDYHIALMLNNIAMENGGWEFLLVIKQISL